MMIYDLKQITEYVKPIAEKYSIPAMYVFGSYAMNQASEDSDIDFLIDRKGSKITDLWELCALCSELEAALGKNIDMITVQQLETESAARRIPYLVESIDRDRVQVYG